MGQGGLSPARAGRNVRRVSRIASTVAHLLAAACAVAHVMEKNDGQGNGAAIGARAGNPGH